MNRLQAELEENEKSLADFTEHLKKLEEEAGEIMKACQEAEVSTLLVFYVWGSFFFPQINVQIIIIIAVIYSNNCTDRRKPDVRQLSYLFVL